MKSYLIKNALVVNESKEQKLDIYISNGIIEKIYPAGESFEVGGCEIVDASGMILMPGVIDDQVHFREPGLTHKGDINSESKAAVAGGTTSFMDMPNVKPQSTSIELLEKRYEIAKNKSYANYSFYLGATNDNIEEIKKINPAKVCGLKVFMGSSTGNMLVDDDEKLKEIFQESPVLIATHCEDTPTIEKNINEYKQKYGDDIPMKYHGKIRSDEACYLSSSKAVDLAKKYGTRLHVLHLSTAKELDLFTNEQVSKEKKITAEVCVHHLWFNDSDYEKNGAFIRWNPAIKSQTDQEKLWEALLDGRLDVIATDHAPHTIEEKTGNYVSAAGGGPLVQHSLVAMLQKYNEGKISLPKIVEKMAHAPADIFRVKNRGYIREGYYADIVLVKKESWIANSENTLYKCNWTPFDGIEFDYKISKTFVNGSLIYDEGRFNSESNAMRIEFER
ncbi:MAG: dihydroorotase [Marinifilaceae bacterium]|jgi:dihydroorotase|nr:dihydroorotase [Marinifilaceae bacterium]